MFDKNDIQALAIILLMIMYDGENITDERIHKLIETLIEALKED